MRNGHRRFSLGVMIVAAALALGGGAGYWFGQRNAVLMPELAAVAAPAPSSERKVLYYKDPMGKPDYSPAPKKDSMGMDYIPVYEDEADARQSPTQAASPAKPKGERKVLYYRNPMGLPDTSPVPKKDSMGMDYVPVYADEQDDSGMVKISPAKVQMLGVQTAPAQMREITRTIRAVGTVQANERSLYIVNTKFDGWIEKLDVDATGEIVRRGQPLMEVYAPELVVAEQEYVLAYRALGQMAGASPAVLSSARQLADASLQRLKNWDISEGQIRRLQRDGTVVRTLTIYAPADGVVMEKTAIDGMRFMAGEPLYRIADLSTVWLIAEVFEQDLGSIQDGQGAKVTVNAYPGKTFTGKVDFIYPTVSRDTRTAKVRLIIPNPDLRLKVDMYANVELAATSGRGPVLAVPASAVIDSGTKQVVLVERGEGIYEPREVKLGARTESFDEVRAGLKEGERVVVSANFLIDAESNLRAALKAFAPPASEAQPAPTSKGKS